MSTQSFPALIKGIVFVDSSVADADLLLDGVATDLSVVFLDPSQDGITQITHALQSFNGLESLHIVSHGEAGGLFLGASGVNTSNLERYSDSLARWGKALSPTADILLYGCNVGQGLGGRWFVNRLSQLTGADVAASENLTGRDGDWEFEVFAGVVETASALSRASQDSYSSNLNVITVTSTADSGSGSLRAAVASAPAGSVIKFAPSLANRTIQLTSGEIFLGRTVTIDGSDVPNLTISGGNRSRIFQVGTPRNTITATFKGLTLVNGNGVGAQVTGLGGAINAANFNNVLVIDSRLNNNRANRGGAIQVGSGAQLTILNSSFDRNDGSLASNGKSGGAISTNSAGGAGGPGFLRVENSSFTNNRGFNGGAIYNISSPVTIKNSVFLNNTATGNGGGGLFSDGAGPGGPGTINGGTIRIQDSWFEGNQAKGGGGAVYAWGYGSDQLIVENSTMLKNSVTRSAKNLARGGAIEANGGSLTLFNVGIANNVADGQGGGLWVQTGRAVTISNTTFAANSVVRDAGGAMFLNTGAAAPVNIVNSTIAHNTAGRANGALWMNRTNKDAIALRNTIVAFNTAGEARQNQVGFTPRDGGGNIEFPAPVNGGPRVAANSRIVDPGIGPLMQIGDDLVYPLLAGSSAINSGVRGANVPSRDQRQFARDRRPDVGAFERGGLPTTGGSGNDILLGTSENNSLSGNGGNDFLIGFGGADTLTGGPGADIFVYTGRSQPLAHSQSTLAALDRIVDLDVTQGDRIQLDYDNNLLTREVPTGLFNAGSVNGSTLEAAAVAAYRDKNQVAAGAQAMGANQAVMFRWGSRTFLSVNDSTAGFSRDTDLVVEITGARLAGNDATAGVLSVANYFI